jgi:hypothetical protein
MSKMKFNNFRNFKNQVKNYFSDNIKVAQSDNIFGHLSPKKNHLGVQKKVAQAVKLRRNLVTLSDRKKDENKTEPKIETSFALFRPTRSARFVTEPAFAGLE